MSSEWQVHPLEDCLEALIDYRGKTPEKTNSGIPLITAKIIKSGRIEQPTEFIAVNNYESWMRRGIPKAGDVVLTVEAPLGEVAQLGSEKVALAQRVVTLRGKAGFLDSTYLLYLLQSEETLDQLKSRATGTTVLGIKQSELRKVPITVPPLPTQVEIASILKALDDRITLLRETNKILESIAQAIFKSWFVDFDPVRAKMEGRQPEGMDEATAALFPDSFEESEPGLIPKGWTMRPLTEAFEVNPSRQLAKGAESVYLEMSNVPTQGFSVSATAMRPYGSGTKFMNGDTLLARITPCLENGKTAYVDFLSDTEVGWGSTEFIVLSPKAPLASFYAYLLCRTAAFRDHAIQSMSGTSGRQRVQNDALSQFNVAVPTEGVAKRFAQISDAIRQKITSNHIQANLLASLRDTLLPRLISGQLRLPDAEAIVNEHV